jgi:hypothetical protein
MPTLDWRGKTVGTEAEDLSHHDKWRCMRYRAWRCCGSTCAGAGAVSWQEWDGLTLPSWRWIVSGCAIRG